MFNFIRWVSAVSGNLLICFRAIFPEPYLTPAVVDGYTVSLSFKFFIHLVLISQLQSVLIQTVLADTSNC